MEVVVDNKSQSVSTVTPIDFNLQSICLSLLSNLMPNKADETSEEQYLKQYRKWFFDIKESGSEALNIESYVLDPHEDDKKLIELYEKLNLSIVELMVVSMAINTEFNAMFGRIMNYFQNPVGGARPMLGLLDNIFQPLIESHEKNVQNNQVIKMLLSGNLFSTGVLELLNTSSPLTEQSVQIPVPLALALTENKFNWPGATLYSESNISIEIPDSFKSIADKQAVGLSALENSVLVIHSGSINEACVLANLIAQKMSMQSLLINDCEKVISGLGVLCVCDNLLPVFLFDLAPSESKVLPETTGYTGPIIVVSGLDGMIESKTGNVSHIHVSSPNREERKKLWYKLIKNDRLAESLAVGHIHSISRIMEISRLAIREAKSNNKDVELEDIKQVMLMSESSGLNSLAEPVKSEVENDALVVRKQTSRELSLLQRRCTYRENLVDGLGVSFKARYQIGVKALFVGPSGTGKTLAASWLATQIGLPLYRVDLASVTSKYIGETEKNLSRLLAQAEMDDVILLFDEADSMFGKRTDVKDSNDRFANAQTNYLLQRIETYKGIVILTSNSKSRFDDAFTRRLDMMIEFPKPEAKERREIWLSHLGDAHSLTSKEINTLAVASDLCGGHIRNAVLSAMVYAKANNELININYIVRGLKGECKKLGKSLSPELKVFSEDKK